MPEQQRSNNPKVCFNWFQPGDIERGRGEALSIRQMIEKMITDTGMDRRRVFVTGLSAGGAMTSVMLAAYPDIFAGGAIVAGFPYGAATNVQQSFETNSSVRRVHHPVTLYGHKWRLAKNARVTWAFLTHDAALAAPEGPQGHFPAPVSAEIPVPRGGQRVFAFELSELGEVRDDEETRPLAG